jgi:hypothetical protein
LATTATTKWNARPATGPLPRLLSLPLPPPLPLLATLFLLPAPALLALALLLALTLSALAFLRLLPLAGTTLQGLESPREVACPLERPIQSLFSRLPHRSERRTHARLEAVQIGADLLFEGAGVLQRPTLHDAA